MLISYRMRRLLNKTQLILRNPTVNDSSKVSQAKFNFTSVKETFAKSMSNIKRKITREHDESKRPPSEKKEKSLSSHPIKCPEPIVKLCNVDEEAAEELIR